MTPMMKQKRWNLVRRMKEQQKNITDYFTDVAYWNESHPKEKPITADPDGVLIKLRNALNAALAKEKRRGLE